MQTSDHLMVISAMSRMAQHGGWTRILDGTPLEDPADLVDVDLLVEAGVLQRLDDQRFVPVESHPWHWDPPALAAGTRALLLRALHHADGAVGSRADVAVAQGRSSASAATVLGESLLPRMTGIHERFVTGRARFLDVGVGVGAFAVRLCGLYPGVRAVGLDVLPEVLDLASADVTEAGLAERIELRLQSVADLSDSGRYDLAWLPQPFIAPADLRPGLRAVCNALRPGGWLAMLLAAAPSGATPFERAVQTHAAHLTGGGPVDPAEVAADLAALGFTEVHEIDSGDQSLLLARAGS